MNNNWFHWYSLMENWVTMNWHSDNFGPNDERTSNWFENERRIHTHRCSCIKTFNSSKPLSHNSFRFWINSCIEIDEFLVEIDWRELVLRREGEWTGVIGVEATAIDARKFRFSWRACSCCWSMVLISMGEKKIERMNSMDHWIVEEDSQNVVVVSELIELMHRRLKMMKTPMKMFEQLSRKLDWSEISMKDNLLMHWEKGEIYNSWFFLSFLPGRPFGKSELWDDDSIWLDGMDPSTILFSFSMGLSVVLFGRRDDVVG